VSRSTTNRLTRAAEALGAKCRSIGAAPLAAFTQVPRADELELARLYAEWFIAHEHPMLAAFSTFSMQSEPGGQDLLQFRCNLPMRKLLSFGACLELPSIDVTRLGQLQPVVRLQIESMIRSAERDVADAVDRWSDGAEEDH